MRILRGDEMEERGVKKEIMPLYEKQFRVIETVYNKNSIYSNPISDWQPEYNIDNVMSYFRSKISKGECIFYTYEERYVRVKEIQNRKD